MALFRPNISNKELPIACMPLPLPPTEEPSGS